MNIPVFLLPLFFIALYYLKKHKPHLLFLLLAVGLFVFRMVRFMVGPAPIYISDVLLVYVLSLFPLDIYYRRWFADVPPWHIYLALVTFLFGCFTPILLFGPQPQIIYVFIHKALCWLAFPVGVLVFSAISPPSYRKYLAIGILIASALYLAMAAFQSGSPARSLLLNNFLFRDLGGIKALREELGEYYSNRPNGPFFTGTAYGGASILLVYFCWFFKEVYKNKILFLAGMLTAATCMLLTVSRLTIIASLLSGFIYVVFGRGKNKLATIVGGILVVVVLFALSETRVVSIIGDRFGRWSGDGGALSDKSFAARAVDGPERYLTFIKANPLTLITGVGLDIKKLKKNDVDVQAFASGFISNSFILPLYYLGVLGFLTYAGFWVWVLKRSFYSSVFIKAQFTAIIVGVMFVIFADNYGFEDETIVTGMFLLAGVIIGRRRQILQAK